jgi:hypothetical protein
MVPSGANKRKIRGEFSGPVPYIKSGCCVEYICWFVYATNSSANTCGELTVIRILRIMKIRNFNVYVNLAL